MDAFESIIAMLLRREGWWTLSGCKVALTKQEKVEIGRHSSPRWEIDIVAYRGASNEILALECKSYLDSTGVHFANGVLHPPDRYKLFSEKKLRDVVLARLRTQLVESGACAPNPKVRLGLAIGKTRSSREDGLATLRQYFESNGWWLWLPSDIRSYLVHCVTAGYENDVAHVVAKLMGRS